MRVPLYLGLAASLMLSSAVFAQAPGGSTGGQRPSGADQSTPPATSTAPSATPTPAPSSPSGAAPSGSSGSPTLNRGNTAPSGSATTGRSDSGPRMTQGSRSERFSRGDRWDRGWDRRRFRPAFAFISGPRVFVRPGWCRGLHRGWHFAPGAGEHAGTHRGLFRC